LKLSRALVSERNSQIDSLRAFSFFLVFFYHAGFIEAGYIGVDLFFILSGYLMTGSVTVISQAEGSRGIFTFVKKRISRLIPSILAVTFITILSAYLIVPDTDRSEILRSSLMTLVAGTNYYLALSQDYFGVGAMFNPFTHMWSISAEIHFYVIIAILGFGFSFSNFWFIAFVGLLVGLNLLFSGDSSQSYLFSHSRIFSFLAGYCLYFLTLRVRLQFKYLTIFKAILYVLIFLSSIVKFTFFFLGDADWLINSLAANILGFSLLFLILNSDNAVGSKSSVIKESIVNTWNYLGRISYSLYLVHFPIISYTFWIWGELTLVSLIIVFIASVSLAALNYKFVESLYADWESRSRIVDAEAQALKSY
jgi:peptidoglycan/LPS O-acetylase OafA/YrhL